MPRTPVCPFSKGFLFFFIVSNFLLLSVSPSSAQSRNRLTRNIAGDEMAVVMESHPLARAESDRGRVNASLRIGHASLVFKLSSAQEEALDKLLEEQQDPSSPNYHRWLTPEQYGQRFGMSSDDLAKVSSWLRSQGLTVDGVSRSGTRVFFSGTAARVENVFHTELHQYAANGETRFANATEVSLPAALSEVVQSVRGLDNFRPRPRAVRAHITSHLSGNHFVTPADFATIYNLKPLYAAGLDGTGQKIAVVGQTEIAVSDIDAFRAAAGLPATNLQLVSVDNSTGVSPGDEVEADLDVEWSGGVARNATVLYVFVGGNSPLNVFNSLEFAIDNNLAPVISTSYGNCEANLSPSFLQSLRTEVKQANSQGQTITAASGDAGAADCEASSAKSAIKGLAVDAPASVPEVTGIGGSEFFGDSPNATSSNLTDAPANLPYWAGTTNQTDNIDSALTYIPEMGWNDTAASIATTNGGLSSSGGGVSKTFAKQSWQLALTPMADTNRDVPDVTLGASPAHDATLICSAGSCVVGFRDAAAGNFNTVGGTSVGAPAFAGIVAILNQATHSAAGSGNINIPLYSLAASKPSAFHDITTGDNIVPCTSGSPNCPASAPFQIGFSAGTGYDKVTGLGSVDANVLVTSWPGFVSAPDYSIGGTPVTVSSLGQLGTSTVTVTMSNGFSGTVNLTCASGSLPAGVSCSFSPNSLTASGTSTLTLSTSSSTPTNSTVTVVGTSGATTHSTTINLSVAAPDFTAAAAPLTPAAIAPGGSASAVITIAPVGGFTGAVSLACTSITGGGTPGPTCGFSLTSVANASGTSTLTISTTGSRSISSGLTAPPDRGFGWMFASSGALFAGVFIFALPVGKRRRPAGRRIAGVGLMLLLFFAGLGCGGGSSSKTTQTGGTPAGTYNITVTATSGSITHLVTFKLTVN